MDGFASSSVSGAPRHAFMQRESARMAPLAPFMDEAETKRLDTLKSALKNTLQTMISMREAIPAQRKAMAMQKIQRAKAAIDALKLSVVADPRMVARLAERLAKELSDAVRDYKAAGGTDSVPASSSTAAAPTPETSPDATDTETDSSDAFIDYSEDDLFHSSTLWPTRPPADETTAAPAHKHADTAYRTAQDITSEKNEDDSESVVNDVRGLLKKLRLIVAEAREYHMMLGRWTPDTPSYGQRSITDMLNTSDTAIDNAMLSIARS